MKIEKLLAEKKALRVESVLPTATLAETAQKLIAYRIGALVVIDDQKIMQGIVSERDLLPAVAAAGSVSLDAPVSSVMSQTVITCSPKDEISRILRLMNANAIRHIPVLDDGRLVSMVSIRELTSAYELLQKEANTDPLTQLPNRRPFLKKLDIEFARAKRFKHPLSVAMIDIDHFKRVNDRFGHDAGDHVLRAVSAMIVNEFRTIDLVGRLGGEEFAVIFPETDLESAGLACERLLATLRTNVVPVDGDQINVTASIGLGSASSHTINGTAVLKRSDELLYDAKRQGRDRLSIDNLPARSME